MTDQKTQSGTSTGQEGQPPSRILLALTDAGGQRVLTEWLEDRYEVIAVDGSDALRETTADLYVVDRRTFDRYRSLLIHEKDALSPEILPVLLVQQSDSPPLDGDERAYIDDVVTAPVRRHELEWRLDSLLQKRKLSGELVARNERLNEFASSVSHDLRSPLAVAEGRLNLAKQTGDTVHLDEAQTALDRVDTMIDDFLAFARNGEVDTDPQPVAVSDVTQRAWEAVAARTATLQVADPPTVNCDESRLQRLLENLFRNAVDHGGDTVTVRVGSLHEDSGFYVEDDGPGIPTELRKRVFERGVSNNDSGTGFGLAHVQEIASAYGWAVNATAAEAGGARFEILTADAVTNET